MQCTANAWARSRSCEAKRYRNALAFLALLGIASPAFAQKTDVVRMDNGSAVIGEVEKLERGLLAFSVDDILGSLRIEWEHVIGLTSNQQLDVELQGGAHYFGSLIESDADTVLRIQTADGVVDVTLLDVIFIEPVEDAYWDRFQGDVSTGLSFTKATDILQFNLGGSVTYRRLESHTELAFHTIITSKSGEASKTNTDLPLTHYRFLKGLWFLRGDIGGAINDELGLDFRGLLGAGAGRNFLFSRRANMLVSLLLSGNREYTNDDKRTTNVELGLDVALLAFRYDSPKLSVRTDLAGFWNLVSRSRYRVDFDARLSFDLVKDLFWDVGQIYYRFDSDPSLAADSRSDYGFVTGLRYEM